MQIAIDLPDGFVSFQAKPQIQRDMRLAYALWLYRSASVTLGKATELAGLDVYDFISACKENQVPVIDIGRDELADELRGMTAQ